MKPQSRFIFLFVVLSVVPLISAQTKHKYMTGSAAKGPESAKLEVAPDLDQRLARFREIQMPFHSAGLTASEKELVEKLVDASRYLEEIYWRQSDPEALMLYESLAGE